MIRWVSTAAGEIDGLETVFAGHGPILLPYVNSLDCVVLAYIPYYRGAIFSGVPNHFPKREPVGPGEHRLQVEIAGQPMFFRQLESKEPRPREGEAKPRPAASQFTLDRSLGADLAGNEQKLGHK